MALLAPPLKSALRDPEARKETTAKDPLSERRVRFDPSVRVAMLPAEQRIDARKARKGLWKPGPPHDELWDGDILDFRERELTSEEFKQLIKRTNTKRTSLPITLQKVQRLFSVASDKLAAPITARFGGVDVVGARARLSEDFDEDERDESGPSPPSSLEKDREAIPLRRPSATVKVSYVNFDNGASPPVSPTRRPSAARFDPMPPSGPSPSERYSMSLRASSSYQAPDTSDETTPESPIKKVSEPAESGNIPAAVDKIPDQVQETIKTPQQPSVPRKMVNKTTSVTKEVPVGTSDITVPPVVLKLGGGVLAVLAVHILIFRITLLRLLVISTLCVVAYITFIVSTTKTKA